MSDPLKTYHLLRLLKKIILEQLELGASDKDIANLLTKKGFKSPMADTFLPSTVQGWRLKNNILLQKKYSFQ